MGLRETIFRKPWFYPKIQSGSLELLPLCKGSISLGLEHGTADPYHAGMEMRRHPHGFPRARPIQSRTETQSKWRAFPYPPYP
jgi:hypothetical protein